MSKVQGPGLKKKNKNKKKKKKPWPGHNVSCHHREVFQKFRTFPERNMETRKEPYEDFK